jgi:hypothetical protein
LLLDNDFKEFFSDTTILESEEIKKIFRNKRKTKKLKLIKKG